jgi:diguanylate cyclase (GGDEF)-like protein
LCTVPHFKAWNDSYGHAAGDALLREVAQTLRDAVRSERDLVVRNGGDEFCLVFTETGKATAIERAEDLRAAIAALDVTALRSAAVAANEVQITASIGVAAFPADATTAHELLERADAAMYNSKRTGRNAVSYVAAGETLVKL